MRALQQSQINLYIDKTSERALINLIQFLKLLYSARKLFQIQALGKTIVVCDSNITITSDNENISIYHLA